MFINKSSSEKLKVFIVLALVFLSIATVSAQYSTFSRSYTGNAFPSGLGDSFSSDFFFNRDMCNSGSDFILQVDPLGCTPAVVRSDLLESQNVPVFCPIVATQLNPLIKVEAIDRLSFSGQYPPEVQGVGFQPATAALGLQTQIDRPILEDIGYAVVVLRQQRNESQMPDFVEGNISATIIYDVENAYGVGQATFYLPLMSDSEWNNNYRQYGFWQQGQAGGYLRLESVGDNRASISVYSDREASSLSRIDKRIIGTESLVVGDVSEEIFLPGFNFCLGGLQLRLNDLVDPDTTSVLNVNGDLTSLREGERFLDNQCVVRNIEERGVVERVTISCPQEGRRDLVLSPRVALEIGEGDDKRTVVAGIGDRLYFNEDGDKSVYLAYMRTQDDNKNEEDLRVVFAAVPGVDEKLQEEDLESISRFLDRYDYLQIGDFDGIFSGGWEVLKTLISTGESLLRNIVNGESFDALTYNESDEIFGTEVKLIGFADPVDMDLSGLDSEIRTSYENAVNDYRDVIESFSGDRYPSDSLETLGEQSYRGLIDLYFQTSQMRSAAEMCEGFEESYPNSEVPSECDERYKLSNQESAFASVVVNGRSYPVSLERVSEPTFQEYGAEILVNSPDGNVTPYLLRKEQLVTLDDESGAFVQLLSVDRDSSGQESVRIRTNLREGVLEEAGRIFIGQEVTFTLRRDFPDSRGGYTFSLREVNLDQVAKVSVIPNINFQRSTTDFSFKIGIEKRSDLLKLSPEKTNERINSLNETLERWNSINEKLGDVVEFGNKACLATGTTLTIKNFFANLGGEGAARQMIMREDGGWFELCSSRFNSGEYDSVDSCLLDNNDEIESAVDEIARAIEAHNGEIETLEDGITTKRFLGEDVVDTDELLERLVDEDYKSELGENLGSLETVNFDGREVDVSDIISNITPESTYVTQARDLQLNSRLLNSDSSVVREIAEANVRSNLLNIYTNSRIDVDRKTLAEKYGFLEAGTISTGSTTELPITDVKTFEDVKGGFSGATIDDNSYVYVVKDYSSSSEYLLVLDDNYFVEMTYLIGDNGELSLFGGSSPNPLNLQPKYYDKGSYENECTNCRLRYYETGEYEGLPSVVPFDIENGWYAAIKSTLSSSSSVKAYSDSGRVSSFYLCNVGNNGKEEFFSGVVDDTCVLINPGLNQPYDQFPGLSEGEASALTSRAVTAIAEASRLHRPGLGEVSLFGQTIKVGEPATGVPDIECQDFMSAAECNLMFNVCDPVVCPSSRCDLGGRYPVTDVVQSGVFGSLALCLPNWPEVKIPVCLSGVHAGIEGYTSVLENYQSCLQHSLETGQQIGICDQLHSVYMCDFFWRQALPVANSVIPNVLGNIIGQQSSRGGGEYFAVQDAWQRAGESANYFVQQYAVNSYNAFQARSLESVGTEICRNWVSLSAPDGGNLLDSITAPRVPAQFTGWFDEIPFSTATVPPISQYSVFYNIYAGEDVSAYYQVYLRSSGEAFFQDTNFRRIVATGFIPVGGSATCGTNPNQPCDFTAPSGFNEMCIVVNNQEECGFQQVSTDFGLNYISDQYVASQVSNTDISSERECISGTVNIGGLVTNPNLQSGVENVLDPGIYNRGINRICSTSNPGSASDPFADTEDSRWVKVGVCDSNQISCWLDTWSVDDAIRDTDLDDKVVQDVTEDYLEVLKNESGYLSSSDFDSLAREINSLEGGDSEKRISLVNENIIRVFLSYERGFLTLKRGDAYKDLVLRVVTNLLETESGDSEEDDFDPEVTDDILDNLEVIGPATSEDINSFGDYPVFEFNDGRIFGEDIYYTFSDGVWYWSEDGQSLDLGGVWYDVKLSENTITRLPPDDVEFNQEEFLQPEFEAADSDATFVSPNDLPSDTINEENSDFTQSLIGQSYYDGLSLLLSRVITNEESNIFSDSELSTERVDFGPNRIFSVFGAQVLFAFNESSGSWDHIFPGSFSSAIVEEVDEMVVSLEGKSFLEGAVIIFSLDSDRSFGQEIFTSESKEIILPGPTLKERADDSEILESLSLYEDIIEEASSRYGIRPELIKSIIIQESSAIPSAVGDNGASNGLMQVQNIAARDVRDFHQDNEHETLYIEFTQDPFNPNDNIKMGTAYFARLVDYYSSGGNSGEDLIKISLAAYNYGIGSILSSCENELWTDCSGLPSSTLQYISNIIYYSEKLR